MLDLKHIPYSVLGPHFDIIVVVRSVDVNPGEQAKIVVGAQLDTFSVWSLAKQGDQIVRYDRFSP